MTPRPNVSEQRRTQIIEAAQSVFARLGFHKARMDDIAQEAGVSKGTLYWYYRSKDAIIAAILDRIFSQEVEALKEVLAGDGPVAERLRHLVEASTRHVLSLHFLAPIAFEFYALAARNKNVREALRRYYAIYRQDLTRLIEEGIASGEFRPDVNANAMAQSIIGLFEGLILLWVVDPDHVDLAEQAQYGMEMFIRSMQQEAR